MFPVSIPSDTPRILTNSLQNPLFRAMIATSDVVDRLAEEAGAADKGEFGFYKIACNATGPSLFLTFNGQQYEIPPSELVRPVSATDSDCILNVYANDYFPNFFSLGASIARKYCLIFDFDNVKLGLASNRYGN